MTVYLVKSKNLNAILTVRVFWINIQYFEHAGAFEVPYAEDLGVDFINARRSGYDRLLLGVLA